MIDSACYVLGAGASAPHVPTIGQLPDRIAGFAERLGSFPATRIPDSALRRLIAPLIEQAAITTSLDEWKRAAMTADTIAIILEQLICVAHWQRLPQYDLFQLLPRTATVVSFNWDGLAAARCRQSRIIHPHGYLPPRLPYSSEGLDDQLFWSQEGDSSLARDWVLPGLILPGEEDSSKLSEIREDVFTLWRKAPSVIAIGYSFGLTSGADYDRVWLDAFVEAMRVNRDASIHVVAPDAEMLRARLIDVLDRAVNVHAWPINWHCLARAVFEVMTAANLNLLVQLRAHIPALERAYAANLGRPVSLASIR